MENFYLAKQLTFKGKKKVFSHYFLLDNLPLLLDLYSENSVKGAGCFAGGIRRLKIMLLTNRLIFFFLFV